jgi:SAM-dependent methyltransferase
MCDFSLGTLEQRLVDRLLALKPFPASLLEMGCGEGRKLLTLKNDHSIDAFGVDTHEPSLFELKSEGVETLACDMRHMPFDNASFDWVLIANALHHIPNPQDAVREAARVARHGVVICEPWWDQTIDSQRTTYALCEWSNALVQSFGYFHRTGLSAGEILQLVDFNATSADIHYELDIARWDVDEWLVSFEPWLAKLPREHYLYWRLNQLLASLPTGTATRPGQVIVVLRKAPASATSLHSGKRLQDETSKTGHCDHWCGSKGLLHRTRAARTRLSVHSCGVWKSTGHKHRMP